MASLAAPVLRQAPARSRVAVPGLQRRWAQVHDVRFVATHPPAAEKIYEKYRAKLEKKARE